MAFRYEPEPPTAERFIRDFIEGYKFGNWKKSKINYEIKQLVFQIALFGAILDVYIDV